MTEIRDWDYDLAFAKGELCAHDSRVYRCREDLIRTREEPVEGMIGSWDYVADLVPPKPELPKPQGWRHQQITAAITSLRQAQASAYRAFSRTDWGNDNGCKAILHQVQSDLSEKITLLKAADALDKEDPH